MTVKQQRRRACSSSSIKATKIYYGGPSRGKSAQKVVSIAAAAENFHHQDWPSLRDNDRHHVVEAPPHTSEEKEPERVTLIE